MWVLKFADQTASQGTINICPLFWAAPLTGQNSQTGVLVHEASHFKSNGECKDYASGERSSLILAMERPGFAIFNADSHMYFALSFLPGSNSK